MNCIVFHNANSGWGNHTKSSIKAALKLAGFDTSFYTPDQRSLLNLNLRDKVDLIVAAGGDGTVAKIVVNLADRSVPVAILPLGTANNIARSLGVFGQPVDLAESWDLDHSRQLNVGSVKGPWGRTPFVESFGVGPFAKLIKKGAKLDSKGAEQLRDGRRMLAKIIAKAKPLEIRATMDGVGVGDEILAFEATSIAYAGPGLKLASGADAGDGWLDVITLTAANRDEFCRWLEGPRESDAPVVVNRARRIEVAWSGAPYRIDDDSFDAPDQLTEATIELDRQPVKILMRPDETSKRAVRIASPRPAAAKHAG